MNLRHAMNIVVLAVSAAAITGCVSEYGFVPENIRDISKDADPSPSPSPTKPVTCASVMCAAPPMGCQYVNPAYHPEDPSCMISCGTLKCDPKPSPSPSPSVKPSPSPSPSPSVKPSPSPSPSPSVKPSPSPSVKPSPTPTPKAGKNEYMAPEVDDVKIDMLFVVDNSGSMKDEQKTLGDSFAAFIDQFLKRNVDFHIGVISTDTSTSSKNFPGKLPSGFVDPDVGRLLSRTKGERYLTRNSKDLVNKFKDNTKLGTSGSGSEQGLHSVSIALSDNLLYGFNEGFMREDSLLSVIVVSDENEDITNKETVDQRIDRVVNRVKGLKGPNSRGYRFDFVVNSSIKAPNPPYFYPLSNWVKAWNDSHPYSQVTETPYPEIYLKAAQKTASRVIDIHKSGGFGNDLVSIGSDIINQGQSEYKLTEKPIAGTLKVYLDGKAVAADAANGYVYHADRNTIELKGESLLSSPGGKVTIEYQYLSL